MKTCPNCSHPLGFLSIACHQDVLVCPGCKTELTPDNRSLAFLYVALAAYVGLVLLLIKNIRGLTYGWALVVGAGISLAGVLLATWVFACRVRHRVNHGRALSAHS